MADNVPNPVIVPPAFGIPVRLGLPARQISFAVQSHREGRFANISSCNREVRSDPKRYNTRALQHYLGHKNIQHTVRYTEMAPDRFKNFWRS